MPVIETYILLVAIAALAVGVLGTRMNTLTRPAGQSKQPFAKAA